MKSQLSPSNRSLFCPLIFVFALTFSTQVIAQTTCPKHYFESPPQLSNAKLQTKTRELCSIQFAVLHSGVTRTPLYTAEMLTRETVRDAKEQVRYNTFHPDPRLPASERSELKDFARSGYDRGHMAPSGDMPTLEAQQESFALSNMIPQNPQNNRYLWAGIESTARQMAKKAARLYVVSGVMFTGTKIATVGDRVMVPTHLFKAIYNPKTGEAAAYLVRNDSGGEYAAVDMATVERLSGIRPFPSANFRLAEMSLPEPIARGSKTGKYQRVSVESIIAAGGSYGAAPTAATSPQHALHAGYGASPFGSIAQTLFKRIIQK